MKPTTLSWLLKCKQEKRRFATITAYDYSFAKLFAEEGINVMLVGDSLGMTVQGHDSTLPVTVADIAYHTQAVRRGAPACLLLADLPFMAYATPEQAFENAAAVMRAGANMVKIEGGRWLAPSKFSRVAGRHARRGGRWWFWAGRSQTIRRRSSRPCTHA